MKKLIGVLSFFVISLMPSCNPKQVTITFNPNGGYFDNDTTSTTSKTVRVNSGTKFSSISKPSEPKKKNYYFDYWSIDERTAISIDYAFTKDTTLKACWTTGSTEITLKTPSSITVEDRQISYIQYSQENLSGKVPTYKISDSNILMWLGDYQEKTGSTYDKKIDDYNGYIPIVAVGVGTASVTISLSGYKSATVSITVKNNNYVDINTDDKNEATNLIKENIMKKTASIKVRNTIPTDILYYIESDNTVPYALEATDRSGNKYYVFSYFDNMGVDSSYNEDLQYPNVINANAAIRDVESTYGTTFPIDSVSSTYEVSNSEQLWWCVEHGKRPTFSNTSSTAYKCYQKAREICSKFPASIKNNNEAIMKVVYEHIISNYEYNYYLVEDESKGGVSPYYDWHYHAAYYLEGPLLYGRCVCDGYSKLYSLLCGILGLTKTNVIRSSGYDTNSGGGHAYNYVSPKGDSKYYLVCPTWGQMGVTKNNKKYCVPDYSSFCQSKNYFYDKGGYSFDDLPWTFDSNVNKQTSAYYSYSILAEDGYKYSSSNIQSNLKTVFEKCSSKNITGSFAVSFVSENFVSDSSINTYVKNAKDQVPAYSSYSSYGFNTFGTSSKKINNVYFYTALLVAN